MSDGSTTIFDPRLIVFFFSCTLYRIVQINPICFSAIFIQGFLQLLGGGWKGWKLMVGNASSRMYLKKNSFAFNYCKLRISTAVV
jgi:hypothetical protein